MKTLFLPLLLALSFVSANAQNRIDITLKGKIKNSNKELLTLNYVTYHRGGLNYTGFKSISTSVDKNGVFSLSSKNISQGGAYSLDFNDSGVSNLFFFKNDEIEIEFDMKNPGRTLFAKGKGGGKINMLHLEQFDHRAAKKEWNPEQCMAFSDSLLATKLNLLRAIYNKELNDKIITEAKNRTIIQRIIKESPLSKKEYDFIEGITYLQNYNTIAEFVFSKAPEMTGHETINFDSALFKSFNTPEYKKHTQNLEYWLTRIALTNILKIEYLRNISESNSVLNYKELNKYFSSPEYTAWERSYLKENFPAAVHDKFYADDIGFLLTMDSPYMYYEDALAYLQKNETTNFYYSRVSDFKNEVENGLKNTNYNLNDTGKLLNKEKFDTLLEKHKGQNILVVFWSVQYAGSSIINQIPSLYYLEKTNDLKIIYVGIDKAEYKNLWAARIIDNQWKGQHYFMPVETNETTLEKFSNKKIYVFCEGGATFTFISKDYKVSNNIENPYILTSGKIKEYIK